jgi:hypothetical protein
MSEEQSGHEKDLSKTKNIRTDQNTRGAAERREGMGKNERSALPTKGPGEETDAGYWKDMKPGDSSDMSMDKSRFGVFEKEGGTGASVARQGTDFEKDVRPMNQSGIYAEKDAQTWKDMAAAKDADWCGTPSDESCEIVGAPTDRDNRTRASSGRTADTGGESPATGTRGQHWRGEPWAKNPKVGGKETENEAGRSGQHWRGDDVPGRGEQETDPNRQQRTGGSDEKLGKSLQQEDRK